MPTSAVSGAARRAGTALALLLGAAAVSATAYASSQMEEFSFIGKGAYFSLGAPLASEPASVVIASVLLLGAIAFRRSR